MVFDIAAFQNQGEGDIEPHFITLAGKRLDPVFQKLKAAVEFLEQESDLFASEIHEFHETQYEDWLRTTRLKVGGPAKQAKPSQPFIIDSTAGEIRYYPSADAFFTWIRDAFKYEDTTNMALYKRKANKANLRNMLDTGRTYSSMAFQIHNEPAQLVTLELFNDIVPYTCQSFIKLLKHQPLLGSLVHRVVPNGWIQCGDASGTGGKSETPDGAVLKDEYLGDLDEPGLLCLANSGSDTSGSQFFITMKPLPFFSKKYMVIGRVISGMRAIRRINAVPTDKATERPLKPVRLVEMTADITQTMEVLRAEIVEEVEEASLEEQEVAAAKMQSLFRGKQARQQHALPKHKVGSEGPKEPESPGKKKALKVGKRKAAPPTKAKYTPENTYSKEDEEKIVKIQARARGTMTRMTVRK
jgi:cyclophilin family peptidyl-prolyl cis-trans isomerase